MWETIITVVIILAAGAWFVSWIRGTAKGETGCSCGSCAKSCPARKTGEAGEQA